MDHGAIAGAITTDLYFLHCVTNLHAGSGSSNYGIVDKEVQRDPIDEMPVIHSSSLKGAFREQFETLGVLGADEIVKVFGTDSKAKVPVQEWNAGQYYFYEGQLLFYPVRSNLKPFYYATSHSLIKGFLERLDDLEIGQRAALRSIFVPILAESPEKGSPLRFGQGGAPLFVDEFEAKKLEAEEGEGGIQTFSFEIPTPGAAERILAITKENLVLFHDDDMKDTCKRLPVIARNHLDNGISTNLWYEEVVPRASIFHFCLSRPAESNLFEAGLNKSEVNHRCQIGGGASVGYGLCQLKQYSQ